MKSSFPFVDVLGVQIDAIDMKDALHAIDIWIQTSQKSYICCIPAHLVMDAQNDPVVKKAVNEAGLRTPDGMSMVWLSKLKGFPNTSRVYGPDLMMEVCRHGLKNQYRHFLYGGAPGVAKNVVENLRLHWSDLQIAGIYSPPFRALNQQENEEVIRLIQDAKPDILWVGIGSPKQEKWMAEFRQALDVPVMVGVGAAFDFLSGHKSQAPKWMQKIGLEWLFRLLSEPGRLWKRYLVNYPMFVVLLVMQILGWKRHEG